MSLAGEKCNAIAHMPTDSHLQKSTHEDTAFWPILTWAGVQGYMCALDTPCLDASGQCTQRCVPLATAWCKGICPNALQYVPSSNQAAAASPDLTSLSGVILH